MLWLSTQTNPRSLWSYCHCPLQCWMLSTTNKNTEIIKRIIVKHLYNTRNINHCLGFVTTQIYMYMERMFGNEAPNKLFVIYFWTFYVPCTTKRWPRLTSCKHQDEGRVQDGELCDITETHSSKHDNQRTKTLISPKEETNKQSSKNDIYPLCIMVLLLMILS